MALNSKHITLDLTEGFKRAKIKSDLKQKNALFT